MDYESLNNEFKKENGTKILFKLAQLLVAVFLFALMYYLMWRMDKLMVAMTQNTFMMCNMTKTMTMQEAECINI